MLKHLIAVAILASIPLVMPSKVDAYGAAHVGYTHVGPTGVQHYGATDYHGANVNYAGAHGSVTTTSGTYHAGYGGAQVQSTSGTYHYAGMTSGHNEFNYR